MIRVYHTVRSGKSRQHRAGWSAKAE